MQTFEQLETLGALAHIYKARGYSITSFESDTSLLGDTSITLEISKVDFVQEKLCIIIYSDGRSEEVLPNKSNPAFKEKHTKFLRLAESGQLEEARVLLEELYHQDKFLNQQSYKFYLASYGWDKELQCILNEYLRPRSRI